MYKLDSEKTELEIKLTTFTGSWRKQGSSRKTPIATSLNLDCVDHSKLWKILEEMGIQDHLTCFLRNLYAGQEAIVRTRNGKTDWFKTGKGDDKAVYCHPDYLTYM